MKRKEEMCPTDEPGTPSLLSRHSYDGRIGTLIGAHILSSNTMVLLIDSLIIFSHFQSLPLVLGSLTDILSFLSIKYSFIHSEIILR